MTHTSQHLSTLFYFTHVYCAKIVQLFLPVVPSQVANSSLCPNILTLNCCISHLFVQALLIGLYVSGTWSQKKHKRFIFEVQYITRLPAYLIIYSHAHAHSYIRIYVGICLRRHTHTKFYVHHILALALTLVDHFLVSWYCIPGHTDTILAVRWGVDEEGREDGGRTLVSTSKDKTIRIWDMRAGRCVTAMKALTSTFTSTFTCIQSSIQECIIMSIFLPLIICWL